MPITIDRVDHIVLNCRDVETTVAWYQRVLGMAREEFGDYRHTALKFGRQKFNVRPSGKKDWWSVKNDGPGGARSLFHHPAVTRGSGGTSQGLRGEDRAWAFPADRCSGANDLGLLLRSGRQSGRNRELSRQLLMLAGGA